MYSDQTSKCCFIDQCLASLFCCVNDLLPKKELGQLKPDYQNMDHLQIRMICMCLFYKDNVEQIQIISVLKLQARESS